MTIAESVPPGAGCLGPAGLCFYSGRIRVVLVAVHENPSGWTSEGGEALGIRYTLSLSSICVYETFDKSTILALFRTVASARSA